jgi:hypothetical protein
MARLRKERPPTASEQLEALLGYPWPFPGRPPKHDLSTWTVTDDWPEHIPVTEAEVDVFEAWFGDLFDELFGPCRWGEKETDAMTMPLRAALYLRVSTARQAEHDVSIPDQKRQGEAWCASRGYELVETFVEPGATATNDRRPEFQRMIEAGTSKPAPFDVAIVHSFSRFFRDAFDMEFYVRKLAKNGVKLVSITQEMGDDPMHVMMRQIMALFDEYQSKENAKHVLRAMNENAR